MKQSRLYSKAFKGRNTNSLVHGYMVESYKENAWKTFRNDNFIKWESFKAKLATDNKQQTDKQFRQNLSFQTRRHLWR